MNIESVLTDCSIVVVLASSVRTEAWAIQDTVAEELDNDNNFHGRDFDNTETSCCTIKYSSLTFTLSITILFTVLLAATVPHKIFVTF